TAVRGSLLGFLEQITVDERALPNRTRHLDSSARFLGVTAPDDQTIARLGLAGLRTAGLLAPGRHRVTAAGGLAFTTAVGVIDRVHGDAAHAGLAAQPDAATGLAPDFVHVVRVRDRADGGHANVLNHPHFAGAKADLREAGVTTDDLRVGAGRTRHLRALQ